MGTKAHSAGAITEANRHIAMLHARISSLENQHRSDVATVDRLTKDLDAKHDQGLQLQQQVEQYRGIVANLRNTLRELTQSVPALETLCGRLRMAERAAGAGSSPRGGVGLGESGLFAYAPPPSLSLGGAGGGGGGVGSRRAGSGGSTSGGVITPKFTIMGSEDDDTDREAGTSNNHQDSPSAGSAR